MTDQPSPASPRHPGTGGTSVVRVVLVDDHRMFRSGVRAELGDSVEVVGEAEDVESAVRVIEAAAARRRAARRAPARRRRAAGADDAGAAAARRASSSRCRCPTPPRTSSA